ncbi:hypothetical protein [Pseudomonas paraeruginosa]|uniref:hypothetical protein n=1 Tax=Pseudomonas paraeruginosa TaxID=2994495 RepID=UPI0039FDC79A
MRADRSDAPARLGRASRQGTGAGWLVFAAIGGGITLAALLAAGALFRAGASPLVAEDGNRPALRDEDPTVRKDWDRIVEEVARRNTSTLPQAIEESAAPAMRQTVYNDGNYQPRGADNLLSLRQAPRPAERRQPANRVRVSVVEQALPLKDRDCGAFKEGSLERRACRARIGLQFRE